VLDPDPECLREGQDLEEEMTSLARMICQSFYGFLELAGPTTMEAPRFLLYPLWVVSRYFAKTRGYEWQWCQRFSRHLVAEGYQIAEYIFNPDPWTMQSAGLVPE